MIPEACYARASGPADDSDVSHRAHVANLRKHAVGLGGVWFLTVTGSAPISAMLFNVPIMVGFGQGQGAPAAFAHTVAYSHQMQLAAEAPPHVTTPSAQTRAPSGTLSPRSRSRGTAPSRTANT